MCSRYRTATDIERLRSIFPNAPKEWFEGSDDRYDSYFPKSPVPVYLNVRGEEMFGNFHWGFVPEWAKSKNNVLVNAKSEEVLKSRFESSWHRRTNASDLEGGRAYAEPLRRDLFASRISLAISA